MLLLLLVVILYGATGLIENVTFTNVPSCRHFSRYCEEIRLLGDGILTARLNLLTSFDLELTCRPTPSMSTFKIIQKANDTVIQARIVGTAIIPAIVEEIDIGRYRISYLLRDAGRYHLQIRLVWLSGAALPFDGFMNSFEFSLKSTYIDCIVYDAILVVSGREDPALHALDKPICKGGDLPGRWVLLGNNSCPPWVCDASEQSSVTWLYDLFGFNNGYVWSPWDCKYRLYTAREVALCVIEKNVSSVRISGDSLAREHFQNLIGLLTNDETLMRKVLLSMSFDIPLSVDSAVRSVKISFSPDGEVDNPYVDKNVWFLWDVPLMRYLSSGNYIADAFLTARSGTYKFENLSRVTYYLHPQIQREDPRVYRAADFNVSLSFTKVSPFAFMTPIRQKFSSIGLRKTARTLQHRLLDAQIVTEARWDSSWDGIHYSMISISEQLLPNASCPHGYRRGGRNMCHLRILPGINRCDEDGYMQWCKHVYNANTVFGSYEGGVSRMLTMIWINMMCN